MRTLTSGAGDPDGMGASNESVSLSNASSTSTSITVPSAAALFSGVLFPLNSKSSGKRTGDGVAVAVVEPVGEMDGNIMAVERDGEVDIE